MSKPDSYTVKDFVPLPPKDAEVLTTACDYRTVACGYEVCRWPVGKEGGPRAAACRPAAARAGCRRRSSRGGAGRASTSTSG